MTGLPDMAPSQLARLDQVCARARDVLERHPSFRGHPTFIGLPPDPFLPGPDAAEPGEPRLEDPAA